MASAADTIAPPDRTLPSLLERGAALWAERTLVRHGEVRRSARAMRDAAAGGAATLAAAGVVPGDRVAIMCGNGLPLLDTWLACGWLGAISAPLNTAARGAQLEHTLANSAPRVLVIDAELLEFLDYVALPPSLERIWTVSSASATALGGVPVEPLPAPREPIDAHPVRPGDTLTILYTSGTTGVSKGVCCPHAQFYWWALLTGRELGVTGADDLYTVLPLFHTNALNAFVQALLVGARFHLGPRFSASRFWREVREADATVTYLLGAMVHILLKQPPSPEDTAHRLRIILSPATPAELVERFQRRFGPTLLDGYGSTETNMILSNLIERHRPGMMGRVVEGFEAKVVDEDDNELPAGTPGELVVRAREPFSFATGYFGMPEQTVEAWRNLWFHTGDRVVCDEDGVFRFVDRLKDAIRRRGENISSYEVEQALLSHADVLAVAVVPVPSELGEDEVMAFVVPREGAGPDPVALVRHCEPRLAYFAIPRYLELVDELPLTENGKVRKFVLRERGVGEATWDREAAGLALRR